MALRFAIEPAPVGVLLVALTIGCASAHRRFHDEAADKLVVALGRHQPSASGSADGCRARSAFDPSGSGVLIGADNQYFYVATARHVVRSTTAAGDKTEKLCVLTNLAAEPVLAERLFPGSPRPFGEADLDAVKIRRSSLGSARPYWHMLTPTPAVGAPSRVRGAVHGYIRKQPTQLALVRPLNKEGRFELADQGTEPPSEGDSGGGVFTGDGRLFGLHLELSTVYQGVPFEDIQRRMDGVTQLKDSQHRLTTARRTVPWWTYVAGGTLVAVGLAASSYAHDQRFSYYSDPTRSLSSMRTGNVVAVVGVVLGLATLTVAGAVDLSRLAEASQARQAWTY
jgi:hypothetical protein